MWIGIERNKASNASALVDLPKDLKISRHKTLE
jgi:hypothetical protein